MRPRFLRLLIIEDDPAREERLLSWLPPEVRAVVATSAGKAMGILRLDSGEVYAGVVLDHDLQLRRASETDKLLSGEDVVNSILEHLSRRVPILVHSVNASQSNIMVLRLTRAGFEVTKKPMDKLTQQFFLEWLEEIRQNWEVISGDE